MNLFKKQAQPATPLSPRSGLERKYASSRANLWLVVITSLLNLFFIAFNNSYFPFSPSMPPLFVELTLLEAGEAGVEMSALVVPFILGIVLTLPYLLCAIFAKKHVGWMIAALVFFSIDCIYLVAMYELTSIIIDILFHAWILFYLITGVINGFKLRKMPVEESIPAEDTSFSADADFYMVSQNDSNDSPAETDAKSENND
jgi:hypothetical protein